MYHILTVCVGNICRSPLAEGLFKFYLSDKPQFHIHSAGIAAMVGYPAAEFSQSLAKENGLDLSHHQARQLTPDMISEADLVLVMEKKHEQEIVKLSPQAKGKIMLLGQWQQKIEVPDPYRKSIDVFTHVYSLIDSAVKVWIQKL